MVQNPASSYNEKIISIIPHHFLVLMDGACVYTKIFLSIK
jgi:hypothetical protein